MSTRLQELYPLLVHLLSGVAHIFVGLLWVFFAKFFRAAMDNFGSSFSTKRLNNLSLHDYRISTVYMFEFHFSAINFFLYCIAGSRFRNDCIVLLCKRRKSQEGSLKTRSKESSSMESVNIWDLWHHILILFLNFIWHWPDFIRFLIHSAKTVEWFFECSVVQLRSKWFWRIGSVDALLGMRMVTWTVYQLILSN